MELPMADGLRSELTGSPGQWFAGSFAQRQSVEDEAKLLRSARLVEEALAQDDHQPRLAELCPAQTPHNAGGSADYDRRGRGTQSSSGFDVAHVAPSLPMQLQTPVPRCYTRQGVLPDIQRLWKSFDSQLVLWKYTDPRAPDVMTYQDVTQQIVSVATARPKNFVSGVAYFLVISTPVDVSLHALRFSPGSDRLLPIIRTRHVVATDDVATGVIASDDSTGRIFLGGTDGCVHELQYFGDEEVTWMGRQRKSRRSTVHWNWQSQLPGFLRRATTALFGATETVSQLAVDSNRGLLFSLEVQPDSSSQAGYMSSILVYQIPASRRDAWGRLEEPPLVHLHSISVHHLASEMQRVKTQVFPGLAPPRLHFFGSGGLAAAATAITGPRLRVAKLLPIDPTQGGDIVLCVVVEDGTRIFLRGNFRYPFGRPVGAVGAPGANFGVAPGAVANNNGGSVANSWVEGSGSADVQSQPTMTGIAVHHVRFLDSSVPTLRVKDVVHSGSVTLLLGQAACAGSFDQLSLRVWGGAHGGGSSGITAPTDGDILVAITADLRAVAQRQSRGRSPWVRTQQGLAEHIETICLDSDGSCACQSVAVAAFCSQLPRPLQFLYGRCSANAVLQPVLKISDLAQQQLVPPSRFLLVSNLGVHILTHQRPVEGFRQRLAQGDLPSLREFSSEYTAEQTCALCFQLLTGVSPVVAADAFGSAAAPGMLPRRGMAALSGALDRDRGTWNAGAFPQSALPDQQNRFNGPALPLGAQDGALVPYGVDSSMEFYSRGRGSGFGVGNSMLSRTSRDDTGALALSGAGAGDGTAWRNPAEELTLLRAEHLLLHPQLALQMGFLQAWPSVDTRGMQVPPTALGHSIHAQGSQSISGRLRGLCLYLSRILRPLWLAPIMDVSWPQQVETRKRRREDWWPAPPQPTPSVEGSQWRCNWSRAQREHVQTQLLRLLSLLERCKDCLASDVGFNGNTGILSSAQSPLQESTYVAGIIRLVTIAIEALSFLELIAPRVDSLSVAQLPAATLVRFAELTFRDLVCQPEAREVLQQLMRGGVVACRQLHTRCPRLFSAEDLELQEAFELLAAAQQGLVTSRGAFMGGGGAAAMDHVRISHLVQRALRAFERHTDRIELREVAAKLRAVGAFRGLIGLCARAARARDPRDESLRPVDPTSTRAQQLHYARLECYQVVLEIFEELLAGLRQQQALAGETAAFLGLESGIGQSGNETIPGVGGPSGARFELPELLPVPIDISQAPVVLDAFLRHCLEGQLYHGDELFHFCILKWMTQHGLPAYRYNSPYLAGYLENHAYDQPELLCRYYQHRGQWAEACDKYLAMAQGSSSSRHNTATSRPQQQPNIDEQINLLQSAALCAQMPGSNRRSEPIRQAMVELTQLKHQLQGNAFVGSSKRAGQQEAPGDAADAGDASPVRQRKVSFGQGEEPSELRRRASGFGPGAGDAAGGFAAAEGRPSSR